MTFRLLLVLIAATTALPAAAEDARAQPSAAEILKDVQTSYADSFPHLTGQLRDSDSGKSESFDLTMSTQTMRFKFANPAQIVSLDLTTSPAVLREEKGGESRKVPASRYGEGVRGFDLTYEDLSMSFLYWPDAKILREDRLRNRDKAWVVRVTSPDGKGPYGTVDVWVHKESGAMAKMEAWDRKGLKIKHFEIASGQKIGETYAPKEIRVETHTPGKGRTGITYMTFDKPSSDTKPREK